MRCLRPTPLVFRRSKGKQNVGRGYGRAIENCAAGSRWKVTWVRAESISMDPRASKDALQNSPNHYKA